MKSGYLETDGVVGGAVAGVALAEGLKMVLPQVVSFNT
jgi:hypothetical protein